MLHPNVVDHKSGMMGGVQNLLMKQQFVITHTVSQNEIPAFLHIWITNTLSVKMLWPQRNVNPDIFVKT